MASAKFREPLEGVVDRASEQAMIRYSSAVSLKRIADAAEKRNEIEEKRNEHFKSIRESLAMMCGNTKKIADATTKEANFERGQDFAAGIEQVAFSIGQQIKRGMEAG